jgi:hypothetical protein
VHTHQHTNAGVRIPTKAHEVFRQTCTIETCLEISELFIRSLDAECLRNGSLRLISIQSRDPLLRESCEHEHKEGEEEDAGKRRRGTHSECMKEWGVLVCIRCEYIFFSGRRR